MPFSPSTRVRRSERVSSSSRPAVTADTPPVFRAGVDGPPCGALVDDLPEALAAFVLDEALCDVGDDMDPLEALRRDRERLADRFRGAPLCGDGVDDDAAPEASTSVPAERAPLEDEAALPAVPSALPSSPEAFLRLVRGPAFRRQRARRLERVKSLIEFHEGGCPWVPSRPLWCFAREDPSDGSGDNGLPLTIRARVTEPLGGHRSPPPGAPSEADALSDLIGLERGRLSLGHLADTVVVTADVATAECFVAGLREESVHRWAPIEVDAFKLFKLASDARAAVVVVSRGEDDAVPLLHELAQVLGQGGDDGSDDGSGDDGSVDTM